jgi:hypothetical protein
VDAECEGLAAETAILISEIVEFTAEARCFVLEDRVLDCAVYEGHGDPDAAASFAREVIEAISGPRSYVIDVGLISVVNVNYFCRSTTTISAGRDGG